MKKSVRYHLLGALSALVALAFVLIWACMDEPQLVYEDGVHTVVYPFLTPALPYLAVCAFMLGCTCFVLSYMEKRSEIECANCEESA